MGKAADVQQLRSLGLTAWAPFEHSLTASHWQQLKASLESERTYENLLKQADCFVCTTAENQIVGMSFLVPRGNPTDIYENEWCYIRMVSVHPAYSGQGIGRRLTQQCILLAKQNREKIIALHTSEMMNKARHIYESLGFTVLRQLEPRLGKIYWLYTLHLTKEANANQL